MKPFGQPYIKFNIVEQPLFSFKPIIENGKPLPVINKDGFFDPDSVDFEDGLVYTGLKNLIRDDSWDSVGVVSTIYHTISHQDIVENIYHLLDLEGEQINSDRSTLLLDDSGKKLWMHLVLQGGEQKITDHDEVARQIIIKHATDGTSSLNFTMGAFTFVCSNMTIIGEVMKKISIRHNREVDFSVVHEELKFGLEMFKKNIEFLEPLKEISISDSEAESWLTHRLKREQYDLSTSEIDSSTSKPKRFAIPKAHVNRIVDLWNGKEFGTVNRRGNNLLSLYNTTTEHLSNLNTISPDLKFNFLRHCSSRVQDLSLEFDRECKLASACSLN